MDESLEIRLVRMEEKFRAAQDALRMQAAEYERRLEDLNGAHEKQVKDQSTYISEDKFIGWQGEINAWRDRVTKTLSELEGRSGGIGSARNLFFQIVPLLLSLAAMVAVLVKG